MKDGSCCCSATNDQLVSSLPKNFSHQNLCPHNEPSFPINAQIFSRIIFANAIVCHRSRIAENVNILLPEFSSPSVRPHFLHALQIVIMFQYFTDNCTSHSTAYIYSDKCCELHGVLCMSNIIIGCVFLQNKDMFRILKLGGYFQDTKAGRGYRAHYPRVPAVATVMMRSSTTPSFNILTTQLNTICFLLHPQQI